ncbi:uncharacterized protein [Prorops nasuta]|uniref:uncharacterized protein n=1 Tax=Prorops nasuta TaxID=863751 RepID=UPI0034CE62BF
MADRVRLIIQKRTALKAQMTTVSNILDKDNIENTVIKLRMKRLTELFHNFEELADQLMILDSNEDHQNELESLQERFYTLASRVENILSSSHTDNSNSVCSVASNHTQIDATSSSTCTEKRIVKLPQISLPVFNGKYEGWLSFKNAFRSLIDSRTDLSDVNKLHYLKSVLVEEAAKKINIFSVSSANYTKAWEILERSYEVKRILVSKHISSMLNLPVLEKESTKGLSKLADDMQQHIAELGTLGVHVTSEIAVHILESRLPKSVINQWEALLTRDEYPGLEAMYEFLYKCAVNASRRERVRSNDSDVDGHDSSAKKRRKGITGQVFTSTETRSCIACQTASHPLFRCEVFRKQTPIDRFNFIKKSKLCYNCLRSHKGKPCKLSGCTICKQRHNTLLHLNKEVMNNPVDSISTSQLLPTARVMFRNRHHAYIYGRALLDTGATNNFISETMAKRLGIRIDPCSKMIKTVDGMNTIAQGSVKVTVKSSNNDYNIQLTCLLMPRISDSVPIESFPRELIKLPKNIKLADSEFHISRPVDILIGSGVTLPLFAIGQINLSQNDIKLCLQKTLLGWVIAGGLTNSMEHEQVHCSTSLENLMTKFWEVEEVLPVKFLSKEETECEKHFINTVTRDKTGRYIVRLPFRKRIVNFDGSKEVATKRLIHLERRLSSNNALKEAYTNIIKEYLQLGHMELADNDDNTGFYMPHHAVFKSASLTTKVRIVFDASTKDRSGVSLNDVLMTGPTIQDRLISHLIRFRMYRYVLTADIEKMYRQILVHEEDRRFQKILWRHEGQLRTLQLNTLIFGISSSPYLAIRTIKKLATDESSTYPRAAEILKGHLYVDDLLTGARTIEEARSLRDELISLLERGGFAIRQWASNDLSIIKDLPSNSIHANYILNIDNNLKTLGITWNARDDKFYYTPNPIEINKSLTKRNTLSNIAKIFDPLGLIGPIILYLKRIMQNIWRTGLNWDESLPQEIHTD